MPFSINNWLLDGWIRDEDAVCQTVISFQTLSLPTTLSNSIEWTPEALKLEYVVVK